MKTTKEEINSSKLPIHVAIIMDGNGRWAKLQGAARVFGHQSGVKSVKETVEAATELGIQYLTLYAFSTENWNRPGDEVSALMELLVKAIHDETPTLNKNNIRLLAIGAIENLPQKCITQLQKAMQETSKNTGLTLVLALSYSAKWEIVEAVKKIATEVKNNTLSIKNITESLVAQKLSTTNIPDPELMIRTSGEHRISNFLLWQLAYAEFYFTDVLWPDFRKEHFYQAIINFQNRERRFGKTGEQIKNAK